MTTESLNISLLQSDLIWEDKEKNLASFAKMIDCCNDSVDIFLLPEMFSTGFSMNPEKLAEDITGPSVKWMQERAIETGALIAGSLIIQEGRDYYNRFIAMSADGIVASYDKRHLFRMGEEELHYKQGNSRVVFEWKGWRILPQICYDLRFPVWIRNQDDYDLILFVANWPEPRKEVWRTLLQARALENQSYVVGVNRIGRDNKGINHSGDSMIISPKAELLCEPGNFSGEFTARLSMDELIRFRKQFPVSDDRDSFLLNH